MRKFLNIVSVWNFRSVLTRLSRISIKVFANIVLGFRENFGKILGGFRVYFAKIIFRIPEENFEKVLRNRKNFRVISKNFWSNLENNLEILGEIGRFFSGIAKRLGFSPDNPVSTIRSRIRKYFEKLFKITEKEFGRSSHKFLKYFGGISYFRDTIEKNCGHQFWRNSGQIRSDLRKTVKKLKKNFEIIFEKTGEFGKRKFSLR